MHMLISLINHWTVEPAIREHLNIPVEVLLHNSFHFITG